MDVKRWLLIWPLAAALVVLGLGCDEGPDFGSGLDDGSLAPGECTEYPGAGSQAWAMNAVVPPSSFDGEPKNLDLDSIWCSKGSVKSLIFVLGYPS
jgi:hypothetical protein